jgi:hypothetical protein
MSKNIIHIAVILVDYYGYPDTVACLKSLPQDISIYVCVQPDDTNIRKLTIRFPQVRIIVLPGNIGFAAANNMAIRQALKQKVKYVFLLNNDTVIAKDTIEKLYAFMEKNQNCAVCSPVNYFYENKKKICFSGGSIHLWTGATPHRYDEPQCPRTTKFITGASLFVRANVFRKVGLLPEDYFLYYEDAAFCLRVQRAGYALYIVPQAKIWHKVSQTMGGQGSLLQQYYGARNVLRFTAIQGNHLQRLTVGLFWWVYLFVWLLRLITLRHLSKKLAIIQARLAGWRDYHQGYTGSKR